ncbi:MAG: PACE efflux transporter [Burkholderiaceae bacterium]
MLAKAFVLPGARHRRHEARDSHHAVVSDGPRASTQRVVCQKRVDIAVKPRTRRVLQALLYEVFAIAFVGPVLSFAFDKPQTSTLALAFVLSSIALAWNYVFNTIFERWEAGQALRTRSFARRLAHGTGFEGGLVFILVPVMSLWLDISLLDAFLANLGLLAFFFVYAIVFTWVFDRVFGLPDSVTKQRQG